MKKILFVCIIIFVLSGCSKKDNYVEEIFDSGMKVLNQRKETNLKKDDQAMNNLIELSNINLWNQAIKNGLQTNGYAKSTFRYALKEGTNNFVYYIIDHGVDLDYTDSQGKNELMYLNGNIYTPFYEKLVEKLVSSGCDINIIDKDGYTILEDAIVKSESSWAIEEEKNRQILSLMNHGAQMREEDANVLYQATYSYYATLKTFSIKFQEEFPEYQCRNGSEAVFVNDETYLYEKLQDEGFSENALSVLAFWTAALGTSDAMSRIMDEMDISPAILDKRGNSLLMAAAAAGNEDTFSFLLNLVPQDVYNKQDESLLTSALAGKRENIINTVFEKTDNDWNYDTQNGGEAFERFTQLITALSYHDDAKFFEKYLSSVNLTEYDLQRLAQQLIVAGNDACLSVLLNHPIMGSIYSDEMICENILSGCSTAEQVRMILMHVSDGIKPQMNGALSTILYKRYNVIEDSCSIIDAFIEGGVNPSQNISGNSLILPATQTGDTAAVSRLIEYGADIDAPALNDGRTPLMMASIGDIEILQILLDNGAQINKTGDQGATAICYAVGWSAADCVELLLEYGADTNINVKEGVSLYDYAVKRGDEKIINMLK